MITNLLMPCSTKALRFSNKIEVIESSDASIDENDTFTTANVNAVQNNKINGYGFGHKYTANFDSFENFLEVFELLNPTKVDKTEITKLRTAHELEKFSSDHYLADLFEPDNIQEFLDFNIFSNENVITFTGEELDVLKELPNKEYLLDPDDKKSIIIGLIDIIFPLMYEYRTTCYDLSSESCWTINRLSATFSWFQSFDSVTECTTSVVRRSLIYPLYRNYNLSLQILEDVKRSLKYGKKYIIKCLLQIHSLFNLSQAARYILNDLYIKDYLIFVQKLNDQDISWLLDELKEIQLKKADLCLDLDDIEHAARLVYEENEINVNNSLVNKINKMNIYGPEVLSSSDSSDDSDSSSSSTEDTSTELDSDDSEVIKL